MKYLIFFSIWIDTKCYKDSTISIQIGNRSPLICSDYVPSSKLFLFDVVENTLLPEIKIVYAKVKCSLILKSYRVNSINEYAIDEMKINFTYELLKNSKRVQLKYQSERDSFSKFNLQAGINDFIRSEEEFLTKFDRNQQIQSIRAAQFEQHQLEKQIEESILITKHKKVNGKYIIVLVLLFIVIGYVYSLSFRSDAFFFEQYQAKKKKDKKKSRSAK